MKFTTRPKKKKFVPQLFTGLLCSICTLGLLKLGPKLVLKLAQEQQINEQLPRKFKAKKKTANRERPLKNNKSSQRRSPEQILIHFLSLLNHFLSLSLQTNDTYSSSSVTYNKKKNASRTKLQSFQSNSYRGKGKRNRK